MRLRCPNAGCLIDVPDDLAGVRIRCPHCLQFLVVDPKHRDATAMQIHASIPSLSLDPAEGKTAAEQTANLENHVYDGVPPLSLMLALRAQQGAIQEGFADTDSRFTMTADDWRALAAFEKMHHTVISLRTTFYCSLIALFVNSLVWMNTIDQPRLSVEYRNGLLLSHLASFLQVAGCIALIFFGARSLRRLHMGSLVSLVPWSILCLVTVFGMNTALNLFLMFDAHPMQMTWVACMAFFGSIPLNVLATIDAVISGFYVLGALHRLRPPEILHRLNEAMKYLA